MESNKHKPCETIQMPKRNTHEVLRSIETEEEEDEEEKKEKMNRSNILTQAQ